MLVGIREKKTLIVTRITGVYGIVQNCNEFGDLVYQIYRVDSEKQWLSGDYPLEDYDIEYVDYSDEEINKILQKRKAKGKIE